MKVAYLHNLPLEYYPPATNALEHFASRPGWEVRAWTVDNTRHLQPWKHERLDIRRLPFGDQSKGALSRAIAYTSWHMRTAVELRRWKPDVIIAVEPNSMPALSFYYSLLRGSAPLFIHFHEYYAPEDYSNPGMRLLRAAQRIDNDALLERAVWVSQTNEDRLRMMFETHPRLRKESGRVLPNLPPAEWVKRAQYPATNDAGVTRMVYVGSASLEDTFIRELAVWVSDHRADYSLHVAGNNITEGVWEMLESLDAPNITTNPRGCSYAELPDLLTGFDIGLILYRGNTLNFQYNVPNKAIEYLAAGLEVWYPPEMKSMQKLSDKAPEFRLRRVDFRRLPAASLAPTRRIPVVDFDLTNERAMSGLIDQIEKMVRFKR